MPEAESKPLSFPSQEKFSIVRHQSIETLIAVALECQIRSLDPPRHRPSPCRASTSPSIGHNHHQSVSQLMEEESSTAARTRKFAACSHDSPSLRFDVTAPVRQAGSWTDPWPDPHTACHFLPVSLSGLALARPCAVSRGASSSGPVHREEVPVHQGSLTSSGFHPPSCRLASAQRRRSPRRMPRHQLQERRRRRRRRRRSTLLP